MKIVILTLFPEMIDPVMHSSIIGRAIEKNLLEIKCINIRDFSDNKHGQVDDYIYGGGAGMLMKAEPVYQSIHYAKSLFPNEMKVPVIYLSPKGQVLTQNKVEFFASQYKGLILLCGHYEGIDERVLEACVDEYVSIGDYVLTGGELGAMVLIDAVSRYVPGVLHNDSSTDSESHTNGLLEYPQYTRPEIWRGKQVPPILMSGHHANIEKWRADKSIEVTKKYRPDMMEKYEKLS